MAGPLEPIDLRPPAHRAHSSLGRKYRKGRIISHRFDNQEKPVDVRRETAKSFLLSIPLDEHTVTDSHWRLRSISNKTLTEEDATKGADGASSWEERLGQLEHSLLQRNVSVLDSPRVKRRNRFSKRISTTHIGNESISGLALGDALTDTERITLLANGYPVACYSVLPYVKPSKKNRVEIPVTSHHRIRANSSSGHVEAGAMGLLDLTQEFSLASSGMLSAIWVSESVVISPSITRSVSKGATPLTHQSSVREGLSPPPQSDMYHFRENHTPQYVIINYHPDCLDNREHFAGRNVTTLTLPGYTVSIIKYTRESDMKKTVNEQFNDVFPHVKVTLTKLRSIKLEMVLFGLEYGLGAVSLAHSHVYFEKLILMGDVSKSNRKIIAFVCVILAAKFASDMKRAEINVLMEEACDRVKLSQKELMSFEFPTLVSLQFSLWTPLYQLQLHYDRILAMK